MSVRARKATGSPLSGGLGRRHRWSFRPVVIQAVLLLGALAFICPLLYELSAALRSEGSFVLHPSQLLPRPVTMVSFRQLFGAVDIPLEFANSLIIVVIAVVGTVLSSAVVAYPLALMRFRGRSALTIGVLATMMLPGQVLLIPQYVLFDKLGWVNTFLPLTVPAYFATSGFMVFLFRQGFRMIPMALVEAAKIDGAGHMTILRRIVLPLSRSTFAVGTILAAVGTYNDYMGPLIYLHSHSRWTAPLGIAYSATVVPGAAYAGPVEAAGTILFVAPIAIFFIFAQRRLAQGVSLMGSPPQ